MVINFAEVHIIGYQADISGIHFVIQKNTAQKIINCITDEIKERRLFVVQIWKIELSKLDKNLY